MPLPWFKLYQIRDNLPANELGVVLDEPMSTLGLIGEAPQSTEHFPLRHWFKVGAQQYVRIAHQKAMGFAWAASDGAFAYILTNDTYFDDGAVALPPPDILPGDAAFDWQSIARTGRASGDRRFCDTDFYSQRRVRFDRFEFYYRHPAPADTEPPICIEIHPKTEPWIEAQPSG